jgi:predicted metal-dependent hydrolase
MVGAYDSRFLEGVRLFNEREYFACHDVLEELWGETFGRDRAFYQGLIHAAVALFHFEGGNLGGARKMYESARRYLQPYGSSHLGLNLTAFLDDLQACFADLLIATNTYPHGVILEAGRIPTIQFMTVTLP